MEGTCPIGKIDQVDDGMTIVRNLLSPCDERDTSLTDAPERFEEVLRRTGVRIERIVSRGQVTPPNRPYRQDWDEWVLVLAGSARLRLGDGDEHALAAGDHLLIPAGTPHRVTYTADPTVWLAVHLSES